MLLWSYLMMERQEEFCALLFKKDQFKLSVLKKGYQAVQKYDSFTLTNENWSQAGSGNALTGAMLVANIRKMKELFKVKGTDLPQVHLGWKLYIPEHQRIQHLD